MTVQNGLFEGRFKPLFLQRLFLFADRRSGSDAAMQREASCAGVEVFLYGLRERPSCSVRRSYQKKTFMPGLFYRSRRLRKSEGRRVHGIAYERKVSLRFFRRNEIPSRAPEARRARARDGGTTSRSKTPKLQRRGEQRLLRQSLQRGYRLCRAQRSCVTPSYALFRCSTAQLSPYRANGAFAAVALGSTQ